MTWVRLDDRFPSHHKAIAAGPLACWLYICGLCYCNLHLTDGEIPTGALKSMSMSFRGRVRAAKCLVDVGLWQQTATGWRVHDYLDWNRSRADVESASELKRQAGRAGGRRSVEARRKQRASAPIKQNASSMLDDGEARCLSASQPISSPITPLMSPQATASTHDWPSAEIKAASVTPGGTRWLPGRFPYEAFHHDCPEPAWRGKCVRPEHPGPKPVARICPHHGAVQTSAQDPVEPAW